jgi:hypothetical protein
MGSSGGWSSPRGDEAAARDLSLTGVLRWLGWDERQTWMQEGSHTAASTWREREQKRSSPLGGARSLLNWRRRKRGGGPGGRIRVEDGEEGREGGSGTVVDSTGWPTAACGSRAWAADVGDAGEGARAPNVRDRSEMGDPVSVAGCGRERSGGDGAPIGGPGRHSAGRCGSNRI